MARFEEILPHTLKQEGGFANVIGDDGGMTYRGVSRVYHPSWEGWSIIDDVQRHRKLKHNEFIQSRELDRLVYQFYYDKFWGRIRGNQINSFAKALLVFDYSMNSGEAIRNIQRLLKVKVDGGFGPITLSAVNRMSEQKFIRKVLENRESYYRLLAKSPQKTKFLRGWLNRIEHLRQLVRGKKKA